MKEWTLNDDNSFTLLPRCTQFQGHQQVVVTHDECTFNANDCRHQQSTEDDGMPLQSKRSWKSIMVSDFETPVGRLQMPSWIPDNDLQLDY